jgi:hypothetical protein
MQQVIGLIRPEDETELEAEHGPCVVLGHADGSVFVFRRMGRDEFVARNNRVKRGEAGDDLMLQERCVAAVVDGAVQAGRDVWNAYDKASVFQVMAYANMYRIVHGGEARRADPDEIAKDADATKLWIAGGQGESKRVFGFRKPGRAEVKMFQAAILAERNGDKRDKSALESLLVALGGADFAAWLEENLFGTESFGEVLVNEYGMNEVRVSGKL